MSRGRLGATGWTFEGSRLSALRDKLRSGVQTLAEVYGAPLYGIKTGLNEAFVVNRLVRDQLVAANPSATAIMKPFLRGEDLKRWRVESDDRFLINTPKGKIDIDQHPLVRNHLAAFRGALEGRATRQVWFELQQAQLAYQPKMVGPKVVWPHFQSRASFCLDEDGYFLNNKAFFIPNLPLFELAFLNSAVSWFILSSLARIKRGGFIEAEAQYVGELPSLRDAAEAERDRLALLAGAAASATKQRDTVVADLRCRIPDLTLQLLFE